MIGNAVVTPLQMDIRMKPLSCRDKLEYALDRIADPKGEGVRTCLTVYTNAARAAADAADARAASGISLGPLDGTIVTIKDLFDVSGEVTRAGSKVLAEEGKPAAKDAVVVRRLRAAGAVIVGKTNMSEFAFTAIGVNPHFGTPGNPADRSRVPGGSSSGAAVAVADGMCEIAIGSDTGGSVRMPAALCGVVGFKPSRQRVSTEGAFPLSYSYRFHRTAGTQCGRLRQGGRHSCGRRFFAACCPRRSMICMSALLKGRRLRTLTNVSPAPLPRRSAGSIAPAFASRERSFLCLTTWQRSMPKAASSGRRLAPFIVTGLLGAEAISTPTCATGSSAAAT